MTELWSTVQSSDLAVWLNFSRWAYAAVSTAHVLSIAVLIGSILTLDLRLIGFARWLDPQQLARLVVPVAGTALFCAICSGALLFAGRATEYAGYDTFRIKMALIAAAVATVLAAHLRYGLRLQRADDRRRRRIGIASLVLWLCVAVAGRMIAFVQG